MDTGDDTDDAIDDTDAVTDEDADDSIDDTDTGTDGNNKIL